MWWCDGSGRIELNITKATAASCSHPGDCEADVRYEMARPTYRRQLAKIDRANLANALKEYGAWEDSELADHETNLVRLFWIACGDIAEGRN